ncbi:hypothetical protein MNBD_IGNAVI01-1664 [hydrothermal vent metagenome]|uniref:Uncharacterized protein n=1 Tax=hydrothermal vent metagenome TaxID=652676 RepID=A0A3B1CNS0_9ZZZZ
MTFAHCQLNNTACNDKTTKIELVMSIYTIITVNVMA